ncbi:MAG: hypothetical protein WC635_13960 [Bacteriovorax sp.]|jgi:3-deoxy-D-manno-octulosonic-acid transferase
MSRIIFISLLFIADLIRGPASVLLIILKNFIPLARKRIDFERKNLVEEGCRSFKKDFLIADYCFEVSSEGELEQVRPLIENFLARGLRIEILFSSPSVESKCQKLAHDYSDSIRILRLPLASFAPINFLFFQGLWQWVSASKIIFCRYDFFPELLSFKFFGKKLILLSAADKKHSWFKREAYSLFDLIVAANTFEENHFKKMFPLKRIYSFDFRVPRIFERVKASGETLNKVGLIKQYLSFLEQRPANSNIILGSAWVSDLAILKNTELKNDLQSGKVHLTIVPHSLSAPSIQAIKDELKSSLPEIPVFELSASSESFGPLGIIILNCSGILCELYSRFSFSYVGGGYERSIHSVLEPFLSGSAVSCGPIVHRSTEYDYIKEIAPGEISLLKNPESFYNLYMDYSKKTPDQTLRSELKNNASAQMESIIKEIESC